MSTDVAQGRRGAAAVFLVVVFVSAVGDEIAAIAVMFHLAETGQSFLVAALLVLQLVPAVLLAPLAGQLLDRRDAGRMLALVSGVQAVVVLAMSAWPNTAVLLGGSTLVGLCAAVSTPAAIVLIPLLAGEAFPTRANGLLEVSRSASTLAGPVIGGVLVASVGVRPALLADAVSFALAAAAIVLIKVRRPVNDDGKVWWTGATDGIKFLARQTELRTVLPIVIITVSASSMVNVALVFFVKGPLQAGATALGVLTAAWGVGALVGAALGSRREFRVPERVVLIGAGVMGVAILAYGLVSVVVLAVVAALAAGAANAYQNMGMRTAVQIRTPNELLGRAHAAAGSIINSFFLVGFVLGGIFAARDPRATFVVAGVVTVVAAAAGLVLMAARRAPAPQDGAAVPQGDRE
ncbi:MFS family permease [Streptosporangium album]|uniref:MFS family permease n=1 Tax=Streptosporangium album TaxID=47479 RepID=A0A7W7S515_9ACTN|nr:MFS transporter [Streptosporangium album]MBB4943657.1 MFS family permease [Streptosporangium album]